MRVGRQGTVVSHRLHVLKISTDRASAVFADNLFPYTHYRDPGHDPTIVVMRAAAGFGLCCVDRVKLHPNYMTRPQNRADIYMPGDAAVSLAAEIVSLTGPGPVPALAAVDPDAFRRGPQTLPRILRTRMASCSGFRATVAGCIVTSGRTPVYVDNEAPREGHVEMIGPEVHLGIRLAGVQGRLDPGAVRDAGAWQAASSRPSFGRREGIVDRPAPTAEMTVEIAFDMDEGAVLAACLLNAGDNGTDAVQGL